MKASVRTSPGFPFICEVLFTQFFLIRSGTRTNTLHLPTDFVMPSRLRFRFSELPTSGEVDASSHRVSRVSELAALSVKDEFANRAVKWSPKCGERVIPAFTTRKWRHQQPAAPPPPPAPPRT